MRQLIEKKLEAYFFANVATVFGMVDNGPHFECFSNRYDIVADMGSMVLPEVIHKIFRM